MLRNIYKVTQIHSTYLITSHHISSNLITSSQRVARQFIMSLSPISLSLLHISHFHSTFHKSSDLTLGISDISNRDGTRHQKSGFLLPLIIPKQHSRLPKKVQQQQVTSDISRKTHGTFQQLSTAGLPSSSYSNSSTLPPSPGTSPVSPEMLQLYSRKNTTLTFYYHPQSCYDNNNFGRVCMSVRKLSKALT